jgi:hypothetical protein
MHSHVITGIGRLTALIAALASICALMAISTPPSAHAEQYCWGVFLPKLEATCSHNHVRFASEVRGKGNEHSVCVWLQPFGPIRCSTGPGVWVFNNYGKNLEGLGMIQDNAPGGTVAFGEIF